MSLNHSVEHVFSNEMIHLQERILTYVIHLNDRNGFSVPDIQSCRLVQKSWLQSISFIFRKARKPLFCLKLGRHLTQSEEHNSHMLPDFIFAATGPSRLDIRIPPFTLQIKESFFLESNDQSLSKCLSLCGNGLVHLSITCSQFPESVRFHFSDFSIPPLQLKLDLLQTLHIHRSKLQYSPNNEIILPSSVNAEATISENNFQLSPLIQSVLTGSKELKEILLDTVHLDRRVKLEMGKLRLPATIQRITLFCECNDLKILRNCTLPKLSSLFLSLDYINWDDHAIFESLENASKTLTKLVIRVEDKKCVEISQFPEDIPIPFLRLPVMKKLKHFEIIEASNNYPFKVSANQMQDSLPNVTYMSFWNLTGYQFFTWTKDSKYESVVDLLVSLRCKSSRLAVCDGNTMGRLHMAFPNIKMLELTVNGREVSGLKCIFGHLTQLTRLRLNVEDTSQIPNSDIWDALFIGVPVDVVERLKTELDFESRASIQYQDVSSIRNLSGLTELLLFATSHSQDASVKCLISDVAFEFAFLKMAKLKTLKLAGGFQISTKMAQQWKDANRVLL